MELFCHTTRTHFRGHGHSGVAAVRTAALPGGTHAITAAFAGNGTFVNSTSAAITQKVLKLTTVRLQPSRNPILQGTAVTFTATVAPYRATGVPTGFVSFIINGVRRNVAVRNGRASLTIRTLGIGRHVIRATYSGDANFAPSIANTVVQTVRQGRRN